jgi:hypothetical protein
MRHKADRRCVVRLNAQIQAKAEELADLVGLNIDSFLAMVVLALYEQALAQGELRAPSVEDQQIA